ncbi:MAG TPA: TRAP transporter small permease [Steroidobacteraceae bacterium]
MERAASSAGTTAAGHAAVVFGRLLEALALLGCAVIFAMTLMICADVLLRNVRLVPGVYGLAWANEISEAMLYLVTLLVAPWLLRQGQHIRVDIVLRAVPPRLGWYFEWVADAMGLACCLAIAWYGLVATMKSYQSGALSIKTLVTPEWWMQAPLPVAFLLLSVEMGFRMRRLYLGERAPRDDAVSTG